MVVAERVLPEEDEGNDGSATQRAVQPTPRPVAAPPPETHASVSAARDIALYTEPVVTCEKPKMAWKGPF